MTHSANSQLDLRSICLHCGHPIHLTELHGSLYWIHTNSGYYLCDPLRLLFEDEVSTLATPSV